MAPKELKPSFILSPFLKHTKWQEQLTTKTVVLLKRPKPKFNQPNIKLAITNLQHVLQAQGQAKLTQLLIPGPDPPFQAKRKILRKPRELGHIPIHLLEEKLHLWPQIVVNAVSQQRRGPNDHVGHLGMGEAQTLEKLNLGQEGVLHAGDEEKGVLAREGVVGPMEAKLSEKVERGAELVVDAGDE